MASDGIALPPDVTDVERLLFVLPRRGEMWKRMLLGDSKLNITINKEWSISEHFLKFINHLERQVVVNALVISSRKMQTIA